MAGTCHDDEFHQPKQVSGSMPLTDLGESIRADDEVKFTWEALASKLDRIDGVVPPWAILEVGGGEPRITSTVRRAGELHHPVAMLERRRGLLPGRIGRGDQQNPVEREMIGGFLRHGEVSAMNGVEGA